MKCASILALLLAASACRAPAPGFELLVAGYQSGEHRAGATLITTQAEWQSFWRRHTSARIPPAPEPAVDFQMHSVIVICAGDEPTSGWALEVRSLEREASGLVVHAELRKPAKDAISAQLVTQPYQILLVERTSGTVRLDLAQRESSR